MLGLLLAGRPSKGRACCIGNIEEDILLILGNVSAGATHESVWLNKSIYLR